MAATEKETQDQLISTNAPQQKPSFFKSSNEYYREVHRQHAFANLLDAVGAGARNRAESIFRLHPEFLTRSGKLTDRTNTIYPSMSLIGYAVMKKDTYLIEKIIQFLASYEGKDKNDLIKTIVQEFKLFFTTAPLDSVIQFVEACNRFCSMPKNTDEEKQISRQYFIEQVGGAQTKFEAHIIHLYCSGYLTDKESLSKEDLPEVDGIEIRRDPKIIKTNFSVESPGPSGDYVLVLRRGIAYGYTKIDHFFGGAGIDLRQNAEMLNYWDKVQTKVLESQMKSLESMLTADAALSANYATC